MGKATDVIMGLLVVAVLLLSVLVTNEEVYDAQGVATFDEIDEDHQPLISEILNALQNQTVDEIRITESGQMVIRYVTGTFNGNTTITNTTMSPPPLPLPKIQLSSQPVYQAHLRIVGQNPINETHATVTLSGNSTLTLPNTNQNINTTSNGSALVSIATESSQMKLTIKTQDGEEETATITLYVIERHPAGTTGKSEGIAIAVVNTNTNATSSGMLAPLNGMRLVGIVESQTTTGQGQLTLWEWKS